MKLYHQPFDSGIDQSFQAFGGQQTTALKTCKNLAHQRAGVLSPRPGLTEEDLGATGFVQAMGYVGGRNVLIVDDQARVRTDAGWVDDQPIGSLLPYGKWYLPIEPTVDHVLSVAFERYLIVHWTTASNTYFDTYDVRTRTRVGRTSLGAVRIGALAWRGRTFAPVAVYIDGSNNLQVSVFDASLGRFGSFTSRGAATAGAVGLRAVGHDNGSFHTAYFNGTDLRVAYHADESTNRVELLTSLVLPTSRALCRMIEISATDVALAWVNSANDLYAVNVSTASAGTVRNVAGTYLYVNIGRAASTPTTTLAYIYTSGNGSALAGGDVTIHTLTTTALTTGSTVDNQAVAGAVPFVNGKRHPIRVLNADGTGQDLRTGISRDNDIFSTVDMQDLAFDGVWITHEDQESFVTGDGLPARAVRLFSGRNLVTGLGWYVYEYSYSVDDPDRCMVSVNDAAVVLGSPPSLLCKSSQPGFISSAQKTTPISPPVRPIITAAATTGGSGLTAGATYQVLAVFEFTDALGVKWQSWPSDVQTVTLGGGDDSIAVTVDDFGGGDFVTFAVRIYMTDAENQTIFYDALASDEALLAPGVWTSTITDAELRQQPIYYQEGGVLANDPAPPCRFGAFGLLRLFVGGCLRRERLQFSKETLAGEALGFPDDSAFWIDFPSELTGIAAIDDAIVVFERTRISIVSGAGPDARGIGNFQVREVSRGLGADDWRAVCATSEGVFFTSGGSIWLLPRGFGAPINIGAKVADLLDDEHRVTSVAEVSYPWGRWVHFAREGASRLVLSTGGVAPGNWYEFQDTENAYKVAQFVHEGACIGATVEQTLSTDEGPWLENLLDAGDQPATTSAVGFDFELETHDWSAVGVAGDMRIHRGWLRILVSGTVTNWGVTGDVNGGYRTETLSNGTAPTQRTYWQNIEYTLKNNRLQSFALAAGGTTPANSVGGASPSGIQFAGLTYEYEVEGAAKEPVARRQ